MRSYNLRKASVLLLVIVILALSAMPALAWEDIGGPDFQADPSNAITFQGQQDVESLSLETVTDPNAIVWGTPEYPWGLARAE